MKKIIIAGGRDFADYVLLESEVLHYLYYNDILIENVEIVSGGANGADKLGERFAREYKTKLKRFIPNWKKPDGTTDRGAGIKRNHEMGDYADTLIAFHDGQSRGTADMIRYATKKGLSVKVVKY